MIFCPVGALMQQGTDFCPVSLSLRFLVGVFYFFTLIMISSYTANLASSLTTVSLHKPIESADDLASQTLIKYGVVYCGSTCSFFRDSSFDIYRRMWSFMTTPAHRDDVMMNSNAEGVEKVVEADGGYAFLMESTSIEYIVERKCGLTQIGGNLDNKGYGIAMKPGSGLKNAIDAGILRMQEGGDLYKLKMKWWKQKRGGGQCLTRINKSAVALGYDNVAGIFVVTFAGVFGAAIICIGNISINFTCFRLKP